MATATKSPRRPEARSPAKPDPDRPTHVAVECRLTAEEAEAACYALTRLIGLVDKRVMTTKGHDPEAVLRALGLMRARIADGIPAGE